MPSSPQAKWRPRFSAAWGAAVSLVGFALAWAVGARSLRFVFGLLSALLLLLLARRILAAWRQQLLWRLRNRLLVAYVFVGVIPVVLLLLMALIAAWMLYGNVAVSLVTDRLETIRSDLEDESSDVAAALEAAGSLQARLRPAVINRILDSHRAGFRQRFPAAEIHLLDGRASDIPSPPAWLRGREFSGVVVEDQAQLLSSVPVHLPGSSATVVVVYPLDAQALDLLGRSIGVASLTLLREEPPGLTPPNAPPVRTSFRFGSRVYRGLRKIQGLQPLPPAVAWWDRRIEFFATHSTRRLDTGEPGPPLLLSVTSRVALLNRQLASRLGEFSGIPLVILTIAAILFLLLELAALWTGVKLTRTITGTVHDLQVATEQVQAANFSHRIPIRGRDQLSGLAQAFNSMSASIERLIEESRERQRLEQELEIARQVQEQLFPHQAPELQTLELIGRCRPARLVSGDYFDYGLADPGRLIFTIGDISGKGISAALLMATIQSILRSQVYASRLQGQLAQLGMAELVSRVNRQLCATTSPEKYSTLFVGSYDDSTRRLSYTNAGHLAPLVLRRGATQPLSAGGPVVGFFPDANYEQATVQLQPGDWLVAYTDGLTEVENSYEEEYGSRRLQAFLERLTDPSRDALNPERLAEAVLAELQQWAPGVEQSDDRTLMVARVR